MLTNATLRFHWCGYLPAPSHIVLLEASCWVLLHISARSRSPAPRTLLENLWTFTLHRKHHHGRPLSELLNNKHGIQPPDSHFITQCPMFPSWLFCINSMQGCYLPALCQQFVYSLSCSNMKPQAQTHFHEEIPPVWCGTTQQKLWDAQRWCRTSLTLSSHRFQHLVERLKPEYWWLLEQLIKAQL